MKKLFRNSLLFLNGALHSPPERLVLEATNLCNRSCFFCGAAKEVVTVPRGMMDWQLFLQLADEAAIIKPEIVSLHAHGEPLLHPRIVDMVAVLNDRGLVTEIVTNGDLLTPELSHSLLAAGLNQLIISHPSISPENWQSCRGERFVSGTDKRIEEAIKIWERSGRNVTLRCLVFKGDVKKKVASVRNYLRQWLNNNAVSAVEFWLYQPWPDHVLEDQIPYLYRHAKICWLSIGTLSVSWRGEVSPCPYDVTGALAIDSFPSVSLRDINDSPPMRQFRRGVIRRSRARPSACKKCLINRVPVYYAKASGEEYRQVPPAMREKWLEKTGRECWLELVQKMPEKKDSLLGFIKKR